MNRRDFMKAMSAIGASTIIDPADALASKVLDAPAYFGLHQFIELHPEAVFIKHTNVPTKTDSDAKWQAGFDLARELFVLQDTPGIPLSYMIAIKANLTCILWTGATGQSEEGMGILTDCDFVEGIIDGMSDVGISADGMYMREGNWLGDSYCPADCAASPYIDVAARTGIHLTDFPTGRSITELTLETLEEGTEVVWKDCPDGVVFRRIGYVAPFNHSESWLLNIAKFKAHSMGMTLSAKNLQGMCVHPHIHFCETINKTESYPDHVLQDFQPDFEEHIEELHAQHLAVGFSRWDKELIGNNWVQSGIGMESWAQRTCDSLSATNTGLNIIEGIYGRNGNAFMEGPSSEGEAQDFMTNILIFGKDPLKVDIIGNWLSGHEPGNFGLFHIAKERGLCDVINPMAIPVYLWQNGAPVLTSPEDFLRTPLVSPYLRQDYDGNNEPEYHLVNEPYCYSEAPCFINIPLVIGWNLISTSIRLFNSALADALQSVAGLYRSIWMYDATSKKWKKHIVGAPEFLNNLHDIEPGKGYWIEMLDSAILSLYGDDATGEGVILEQDWNLAGYCCAVARSIYEALSSISEKYNSVWTYDAANGEWRKHIADGPEFLNNLIKLELGNGYWIDTTERCTWSVV